MSRRRIGIAAALLLLLVALLLGWRGWAARSGAGAKAPAAAASAPLALDLAPSDLALVRRSELGTLLPVSGGLRAVDSALVRAKVAAELRQLAVREGDAVQRGQVVAVLDDTEYRWRLRQAEDQAAAAKAQLEIAERQLANNQALVNQGFISTTALETSRSSAAGARASLAAAQAAAEIARKSVGDTVLRAPLSGLVAQRFVQPGERVGIDARIIEIVDLSRIELEAALAPEDVAGVRIGQTARLAVDGIAEPVAARVVRINPSTQPGTRSVLAYLALEPHPGLRHGLFARGTIALEQRQALVVPASAVRLDQARPYVLVATGGRVQQRPVGIGLKGDARIAAADGSLTTPPEPALEITSGVEAGEVVLRGSVGGLRDGTAVRLPAAAAARPTAAGAASAARP